MSAPTRFFAFRFMVDGKVTVASTDVERAERAARDLLLDLDLSDDAWDAEIEGCTVKATAEVSDEGEKIAAIERAAVCTQWETR